MKKRLYIGIICVLIVSLCACNNSKMQNNYQGEKYQEKKFVSDWSEGNENYYGYGLIEDWNRYHVLHNYIIQDQTMYYVDDYDLKPRIYKKKIDDDAVSIVADVNEMEHCVISLIGVVKDYIYYEIVGLPNIYRIRTDGEQNEFLTTHCGDFGTPYIVGNQLFFMSYEQKGSTSYEYSVLCMNVDTKETRTIINNTEERYLRFGYKDYLFCGYYDSDNHTYDFCIHKLDGTIYYAKQKGSFDTLVDPEKDIFTYKRNQWLGGQSRECNMSINGVESDFENWPYSRHSKNYIYVVEKGSLSHAGFYIVYKNNSKVLKLNDDNAWKIFDIGDGYAYYECDGVLCRIKTDGTGWENVSWMYP